MLEALKADLGRPELEAYAADIGFSLLEVKDAIQNLKSWMKPQSVKTPMLSQPASSQIRHSPLGVALIIAPFNYPIALALSPLIAAIAAGNTAILKTSELTPNCSAVLEQLIEETFEPEYIAYVAGAVPETTELLQQKFDHIFFTGSPRVGSIVMQAAAKHLTPVTLELGGKSPCIVHEDTKLDIAVNRIVFGKFFNAGQTCIAPDYILVHESIKRDFLQALKVRILKIYSEDAAQSADFGRIVNQAHWQRISNLIDKEKVLIGGQIDQETRFIAPTVLQDVELNDAVMQEEIFGPVLPVLSYESINDIVQITQQLPQHPLACYVFSESQSFQESILDTIQCGGVSINHCLQHYMNPHLPFGGVGESGMGSYHGYKGFERFSHQKSVLKTATWIDPPFIYPPYEKNVKWVKKLFQ